MLTHVVIFWLDPQLPAADLALFKTDLDGLGAIPGVRQCLTGAPAPTPERPVIETGYHFGLTVVLDDVAAHDTYQEHPIHQAFVERWKTHFKKIQVYDFQ